MDMEVRSPDRQLRIIVSLALAFVIAFAFWPGVDGGFINDDVSLIARNPDLQSASQLPALLTRPMWSGLPEFTGDEQVGHWRPITSLVLAAGYGLGGSPSNPAPFHLLSLAIHLLATFAAFRLAARLLASTPAAVATALLFALHPVHVESVAWISAINDPLFGALCLFALDAWLRWRESGSTGRPWATGALLIAALLTKELAVCVLPLILVLDLVHRRETRLFKGWSVLLGALAVWYLLRGLVFSDVLAGFGRSNADYGTTWLEWRTRADVLGGGMWHLVWPSNLSPLEPFREVWPTDSPDARVKLLGLITLAVALIAGTLLHIRHRSSWLLFASLSAAAALAPAFIAIGALGQTPFADRYLYLSVFFIALLLVAGVRRLSTSSAALALVTLPIAGVFAVQNQALLANWQSPESFYRAVTERHPDSPAGFWNLGEELRAQYIAGTPSQDRGDLQLLNDAFASYASASDLLLLAIKDPSIPADELDYLRSGVGQAWCYLLQAEIDGYEDYDTPAAILDQLLEQTLLREKGNANAAFQRAALPVEEIMTTLGIVKLRAGDDAAAIVQFKRALLIRPLYLPAMQNLAASHFQTGNFNLASKLLKDALELAPRDPALLELYAQSLFEEQWPEQALAIAAELEAVDPGNPLPEILRGLDSLRQGDHRAALNHFDRALALDPRSDVGLYQRAMALYRLGERGEAIIALRRAAETDPDNFAAHYDLASMLFESGAHTAARPYIERAYELGTGRAVLGPIRQNLLLLDPENAPRMRALAELDNRRNDITGALFWTTRAIALDPNNGRSRHLMGTLLLDSNEASLAMVELKLATELLPDGYQPFIDLGRCASNLGRYTEARAAFHTAKNLVLAQAAPTGPGQTPEGTRAFELMKASVVAEIDGHAKRLPPKK